jgi:Tfp pilus assembly protein PilO
MVRWNGGEAITEVSHLDRANLNHWATQARFFFMYCILSRCVHMCYFGQHDNLLKSIQIIYMKVV